MYKKKHIAVLSTLYYPDMGAPSACVDKYVRALKDEYQFHIITRTDCTAFEPSREYDVRYISSFRHRLKLKCEDGIKRGKNSQLCKLILAFINLCKLVQTQFSFPSAQRWEVNQYAKQLELLHNEVGIDVVISVSNTVFTQLATLRFKRNHPTVKWMAFFYDPYSEHYIYYKYKFFKSLWKYLNRKKEQEIYNNADAVLLSSELYKFVPKNFTISRDKCFPLLYPLQQLCPNGSNVVKVKGLASVCKLVFAGMFYKKIRNPEFALSTISQIQNVQFDIFVGTGECEDIIERYNKKNIHREQFLNRERYVEMICNECDVLVNIGNISTLQAPSKMLELLSTGKPILNFYFNKDAQYEMIEKYPLGLNVGYNEVGAVKKVERFCWEMKGQSISFEEVEQLFPDNKFETQVELLRMLIEL